MIHSIGEDSHDFQIKLFHTNRYTWLMRNKSFVPFRKIFVYSAKMVYMSDDEDFMDVDQQYVSDDQE